MKHEERCPKKCYACDMIFFSLSFRTLMTVLRLRAHSIRTRIREKKKHERAVIIRGCGGWKISIFLSNSLFYLIFPLPCHPLEVFFFYSDPPLCLVIRASQAKKGSTQRSLIVERSRFHRAIFILRMLVPSNPLLFRSLLFFPCSLDSHQRFHEKIHTCTQSASSHGDDITGSTVARPSFAISSPRNRPSQRVRRKKEAKDRGRRGPEGRREKK